MTEAEVIRVMREHLEGLFPKVCPRCKRCFRTLREYLQVTTHVGPAVQYDAEVDEWRPINPMGAVTCANCPCGNTLVLSSQGMPLLRLSARLRCCCREVARGDSGNRAGAR